MNIKITKSVALASIVFAAAIAGAQEIRVTVNDQPLQFNEGQPQFVKGRVLVPMRGIFEQMGASVRWNQDSQSVVATKGAKKIRLTIGSKVARVDGQKVNLDVPPLIIDGSTMVPIRFVSESLGAQVGWNEAKQLVSIETNDGSGSIQSNGNDGRAQKINVDSERLWREGTVIPVRLNTELSSDSSRRGDTFSANIDSVRGDYSRFPRDSRIVGHVVSVHRKNGNEPAALEVAFDKVVTRDGQSWPIEASLSGLDSKSVSQDSNGNFIAKGGKDQTNVFAGIGAGAGLILGLGSKRPLEDAIIGGILGAIAGQIDKSQKKPQDVVLPKGTTFGVRLDRDLRLDRTK